MAAEDRVPTRGVLRRPGLRPVDILVALALVGLLYGLLRIAPSLNAPFLPRTAPAQVSTDPANPQAGTGARGAVGPLSTRRHAPGTLRSQGTTARVRQVSACAQVAQQCRPRLDSGR
ncbi:hypothetical protein [Streptacidiphilus sp. P02-A3a]|uniref:hypothetical protein n=1 Tax=Streptacidiphilus sp. P02-A3a TaxID=2704468 RepID=UPI0015FA237E|nr:hypothetical protein [Streptacidiphilus sp. P02-A3a]QMU72468.1 hypothetical protein GXP74_33700 [Streptacidiphilus sp. P02-A3a]